MAKLMASLWRDCVRQALVVIKGWWEKGRGRNAYSSERKSEGLSRRHDPRYPDGADVLSERVCTKVPPIPE
jgi:hypothetical protein